MKKKKGFITVPTDANEVELTLDIIDKWGADAIRDCDGTKMPEALLNGNYKVYSTYFVSRNHNAFAEKYPKELQELFLLSEYKTAFSPRLEIAVTEGFSREQVLPNSDCDYKRWWEVVDRTLNMVVEPEDWDYNPKTKCVTVNRCKKFHDYTVSFLAYCTWDCTHMYNHTVNHWGPSVPPDLPFDIRKPQSEKYIYEAMSRWLETHPSVDVVRFTTFFYHFTLLFDEQRRKKIVDWTGYNLGVSVEAIEAFEKATGLRVRAEDFVDAGYYNNQFRVPSKVFLAYIRFMHDFTVGHAKKLVDMVHKAGKQAMMFVGDNWMGIETHGQRFREIGLDYVVTSVGSGVTERILADIENVGCIEGRFLPYFFPDTFYEGGNPIKELNEGWLTSRRAMLRKPLDRIGFGGYLKLAAQFPDFIERVGGICDEFRLIKEKTQRTRPFAPVKVGILNCWGKLRSWQIYQIDHAVWKRETYSYLGILEALSGLPVEVEFISFDDVKRSGIPQDLDVILNFGDGLTAYSGGSFWLDGDVQEKIRAFVYGGKGFIGIGEPTAANAQNGKYFQLSDVLGVEREMGQSLIFERYNTVEAEDFILADNENKADLGEPLSNIYAKEGAKVLCFENGQVKIACNRYGDGKSYYFTGLKYDEQNTRMLYRACLSAAGKESQLKKWFSSNIYTECNYFAQTGQFSVHNNSTAEQTTELYDGDGKVTRITLSPMEIKWFGTK